MFTVRDLEVNLVAFDAELLLLGPRSVSGGSGWSVELLWSERTFAAASVWKLDTAIRTAFKGLTDYRTLLGAEPVDLSGTAADLERGPEPSMPLQRLADKLTLRDAELRRCRHAGAWSVRAHRGPARARWVAGDLETAIVHVLRQLDDVQGRDAGALDVGGEGDSA